MREGRPVLGDSRDFGWQLSHDLDLPCISNFRCNNNNSTDRKNRKIKKKGGFLYEKNLSKLHREKTNYQSIFVISGNLGPLVKRYISI